MKKLLTVSFITLGIILISGCSSNEEKQIYKSKEATIESLQENDISGIFGPYHYNNKNEVFVAISKSIRAISYYEHDKAYVVINNEKFGPYNGIIKDLKVTNDFWGFVVYKNDGLSMVDSSKSIVINGDETKLDKTSDNIYFDLSDEKKSWGIQYDDRNSGYRKFLINRSEAKEIEYNNLNKITPYQKDDGSFYVSVKNKEYLIGSIEDQGALFAQCMIYDIKKWGCSVGRQDKKWHIFIYDDNVKKEYGPYANFSDEREIRI